MSKKVTTKMIDNRDYAQVKFIELKAQGMSYRKIAEKLNVSVTTLSKWNRQFEEEINMEAKDRMDAIQFEFKANKEARVSALSMMLYKVENEIRLRDLAEVSSSRLARMYTDLSSQLMKEQIPEDKRSIRLSYSLDQPITIEGSVND